MGMSGGLEGGDLGGGGGGGGNNHCLVPEDKSSLNKTKIAHLFCLIYIISLTVNRENLEWWLPGIMQRSDAPLEQKVLLLLLYSYQ